MMKITVFAKKIKTNEGRTFTKYVTTLTKKDGTKVYTQVHFDEGIQIPNMPCILIIDKHDANFSTKKTIGVDRKTGEEKEYVNNNLWINVISDVEPYIDTSLDDFD